MSDYEQGLEQGSIEPASRPQGAGSKLARAVATAAALAAATASCAQQADSGPAPAANVSMCIGCHGLPGYKTAYPVVYPVPLIAGQPAPYLEAALNAYRRGERSHPTMRAIAQALSDEEIVALASYYGTREGGQGGGTAAPAPSK